MSNVNSLISKRLQKSESPNRSKMAALAQQSANGHLTSFSGIFSVSELSENERVKIETILHTFAENDHSISQDLQRLIAITAEVKAINNQAALLHGERIKKAQTLFKSYQEGAFSAWLMFAYGNRQTPYNLLQYYEFYEALPKNIRPKAEELPKQAIYTLASREGSIDKKIKLILDYQGETKAQMLVKIRDTFPLGAQDRRQKLTTGERIVQMLESIAYQCGKPNLKMTKAQKKQCIELLETIGAALE